MRVSWCSGRLTVNPQVTGSSPVRGATEYRKKSSPYSHQAVGAFSLPCRPLLFEEICMGLWQHVASQSRRRFRKDTFEVRSSSRSPSRIDNDYPDQKPDWGVIKDLAPYLMEFPGRVVLALLFLIGAKLATVAVPVALKYIVDYFDQDGSTGVLVGIPLALVVGYGLLRFCSTFFGELRDMVFARVAERAMRRVSLRVFEHLHKLDLNFHLSRRTGGLSRDIERGTNGISFLLRFCLFNVVPTILEILMVAVILLFAFDLSYALTVIAAVLIYTVFSVKVTEWRTRFVRETYAMDNRSNSRAVDSLLNYETVKYFVNEKRRVGK